MTLEILSQVSEIAHEVNASALPLSARPDFVPYREGILSEIIPPARWQFFHKSVNEALHRKLLALPDSEFEALLDPTA